MRRFSWVLIAILIALPSCSRRSESSATTDTTPPESTATTSDVTNGVPAKSAAGSVVTFPSAQGNAQGYLATPKESGKRPAMIVVQEWWGVDDWIREQADRFAGQGYVALAPDLYRGKVAKDPEEAHELMRGMPEDRANADLKAAFAYLVARDDVDPARIGVIGWCMGGGYALALATQEPRVAATVVNYGRLVTDPNTITKINAPILGNFGGADRGIPAEDVKAFGAALTKYGKLGDVKVYDGAGHAFMNPNNKQGYDAAAARDAWQRIDSFFGRTLRDKIPNS
jgi:carboxymethylenebutenolidase